MTDTISGTTIVGFNPIVLRGSDGVSVTNAAVNGDGALVLSLSDGNSLTTDAVLLTNANVGPVFRTTALGIALVQSLIFGD